MAFTEENKQDAYFVFTSMFQAAPGKVFAAEIVAAYNAGLTTAQIVAEYATKAPFLKLYPAAQSNADFATSFVKNVLGNTVTEAVKAKAAKEIEAALNGGTPKAEVIFNSLLNLSKKTVADAEYGKAAQMLANKIAVAKELTEGAKALNTTDVDTLQSPLKNVTEDVATVQAAINGSSALATKLDTLAEAKKALANFISVNKLGDTVKDVAAAETAVKKLATDAGALIKTGGLSTDAGVKAAEIQTAQAQAQLNIKNTTKSVSDYEAALSKVTSTDGKTTLLNAVKTLVAATQASTTATNNFKALGIAADKALADAVTLGSSATLSATGTATTAATTPTKTGAAATAIQALTVSEGASTVISFNTTTKVFEFAPTASAAQKTVLATTLSSLNSLYVQADAADKAAGVASDASVNGVPAATAAPIPANEFLNADVLAAFPGSVVLKDAAGVTIANPATVAAITTGISSYTTVASNVKTATDQAEALAKNIAIVNANEVLLADLKAIGTNLTAAEKSFTDAGYKLPVELEGGLFATSDSDVFQVSSKSDAASIFGFAGKDVVYVGQNYVVGTDNTKGDDSKLEVFFKANGSSTDVYVEQKAFGSNSAATTKDIVKITLTGVAVDKLVLKDGFIALA